MPESFLILPNIFTFFINKVKKIKNNKYIDTANFSPEESELFPGVISYELITNNKVCLISQRSLKMLQLNENKPMILDRKTQCDTIEKHLLLLKKNATHRKLNFLFLTGTSGAGKSILLNNFLKSRLNINKYGKKIEKCLYFNQYHIACDLIYKTIISKKQK